MRQIRNILHSLLFPHWLFCILLIPVGFGMLLYSFLAVPENETVAYVSYGLSAYALVVLCLGIPRVIRFWKNVKANNLYVNRYFSDLQFRVKLSLYGSLSVNLLYAALQLGSGIYYHSAWFYALSGYYAILATMRFFLLKETRNGELGKNIFLEYLHYRLCGVLLLILTLALSVIAFYIVSQNRGFEHNEIITIAMATYTFFAFTMAVINLAKKKNRQSPVFSAVRCITMAAAVVSVLSLEASMISAFGREDQMFRKVMTASTGAAVCAAVLAMAVFMIVHSTGEIRKIKRKTAEESEK